MITRRNLIVAAATATLAAPAIGRPRKRPNVLFIPVDDLNDWIEPLGGYAGAITPNFKRLARHTLGFTRAYAQVPVCLASRASTLFSAPSYETGIYTHHSADWPNSELADKDAHRSIVRFFHNHNYRTVGLGKIFHDGWRRQGERNFANDMSAWDEFNFCEGKDDCEVTLDGAGDGALRFGPLTRRNKQMEDVERAHWLTDKVLSKKQDKPFFAALGLRKPHLPFSVPKEWFKLHPISQVHYPIGAVDPDHSTIGTNEDVADLPPEALAMIRQFHRDHLTIVAQGEWKAVIQSYLAAVSFADHVLGIVLDGLYKGPNADDTIVCVWSDHGWQLGEKLAWRKFTLWERATRIPLFIGGPGVRQGWSDAPISTVDIYPTLAELATGETPPARLSGLSFADHCKRPGAAEPRDHVVSTWALDDKIHHAVRTKTHRLIAYGGGGSELYDERVDPYEINNLAFRPTREARDMIASLQRYVPTSNAPEIKGEPALEDVD